MSLIWYRQYLYLILILTSTSQILQLQRNQIALTTRIRLSLITNVNLTSWNSFLAAVISMSTFITSLSIDFADIDRRHVLFYSQIVDLVDSRRFNSCLMLCWPYVSALRIRISSLILIQSLLFGLLMQSEPSAFAPSRHDFIQAWLLLIYQILK